MLYFSLQEKEYVVNQSSLDNSRPIRSFWHPITAGIALGLVLLFTFMLSGHGLGASGAASHLVADVGVRIAPEATKSNAYLGPMVAPDSLSVAWISWEVLGITIGALGSAFYAGRFRVYLDRTSVSGAKQRLLKALLGGVLSGFGARVAAGCTSGLGLSGAATLGIAAFVFLGLFFATGLVVNKFIKAV
jgi:uncharacterized membrane protein YedE/YeeE